MYGITNKYNVGEDIFSVKDNNIVVYPNGNFLTSKVYYNNSTNEYLPLKGEEISKEYIDNKALEAENRLMVSNAIIVYDLLKNKDMDGE